MSFRKWDDYALVMLLNEQSELDVSYSPMGVTDQEHTVPGYHYVHGNIDLGHGQETFERAVRNIQEWKVHQQVGLNVTTECLVVTENVEAVFQLRYRCLYVTIACRVLRVMKKESSWGFIYGTLPHHAEQGEESFVVEHLPNDTVRFTVRAHSRPGHPLVKLGSPVARHVQKVINTRYLRAMKDLVNEAS